MPVGRAGAGVGLVEVGLAGDEGAEAVGAGADAFGAAGAATGLGLGVGAEGAAATGVLCRLTGFCGAA